MPSLCAKNLNLVLHLVLNTDKITLFGLSDCYAASYFTRELVTPRLAGPLLQSKAFLLMFRTPLCADEEHRRRVENCEFLQRGRCFYN